MVLNLPRAKVALLCTVLAAGADAPAAVPAPPIRIVVFGDSTTASYQDWAPGITRVYGDCLPGELAAGGIEANVINAGIGDTTTREAVRRLDRDVLAHRPAVVVVQFGINDSWIDVDEGRREPRLTRQEYRDNLRTIVRRSRAAGALVVLMTPNPMRWGDPYYEDYFRRVPGLLDVDAPRGIDRLLDVYAEDLRRVAREDQVPLVDVFSAFEAYGATPGQSIGDILLQGDGIHPNEAGQDLVCRLLTGRILEILPRSRAESSAGKPARPPIDRRTLEEPAGVPPG